jgi:BASS family bile acid:Na+ symporter
VQVAVLVLPEPETIVRILTTGSLGGLLVAVGLRLRWSEVAAALGRCRIGWIALANFLLVPALAVAIARAVPLSPERSAGMLLLAAAPFAPVVPVFARLARADLALAAGLTSLFPVLSAVLTPAVLLFALPWSSGTASFEFRPGVVLAVLLATITVPLAAGVALNHLWPGLRKRLLRPLEVSAEAAGAASLAFVVALEFGNVVDTPWQSLLAMFVFIELSFLLGHAVGGAAPARRIVIVLGTGNRNIALALLVALYSFHGTAIPGVVVTIGLMLILCGLVHVAYYRFFGFGATAAAGERTRS